MNARRLFEAVDGGDVRVIQRREQPRLAFEARQTFGIRRKRRGRTLTATSRPSFVSRAHTSPMPPNAEEVENVIHAEPLSRERRLGRIVHESRRHRESRLSEEIFRGRRLRQQRFHFLPQRLVIPAGFTQERRPLAGLARQRVDRSAKPAAIARASSPQLSPQPRSGELPVAHDRVGRDPQHGGVSSTLRPPKNRNSTTRLLRSSNSASADSASSSATRSSALSGTDSASVSDTRMAPPPRF